MSNTKLESRMKNPAVIVPDALKTLMTLGATVQNGTVPTRTLELVNLRASQMNGCSVCIDMHSKALSKEGETNTRLFNVAAWRDAPFFTDAERAALWLTEEVTHLNPHDPVPDAVWNEAKRHYDEQALATLLLNIAMINFWNRTNVPTRQVAGLL